VGLATAGLVPWDAALVAAGAGLVAAGIDAWIVGALVPSE
ncbi:MAG: hypothetical protein JWP31_2720, partial [Aeromicrobium sp.]|nr:hypothetical protein [Aeromicrobium sp.]